MVFSLLQLMEYLLFKHCDRNSLWNWSLCFIFFNSKHLFLHSSLFPFTFSIYPSFSLFLSLYLSVSLFSFFSPPFSPLLVYCCIILSYIKLSELRFANCSIRYWKAYLQNWTGSWAYPSSIWVHLLLVSTRPEVKAYPSSICVHLLLVSTRPEVISR